MIKCLYIAGHLFMTNGDYAHPIGPNESLVIAGNNVVIAGWSRSSGVPLYEHNQSIAEFLIQCDSEAHERVMMEYE